MNAIYSLQTTAVWVVWWSLATPTRVCLTPHPTTRAPPLGAQTFHTQNNITNLTTTLSNISHLIRLTNSLLTDSRPLTRAPNVWSTR